jgi:hypothetical protein
MATFVLTAFSGLRTEARAAHRQVLQPYLTDLASCIAQAMASATVLHRVQLRSEGSEQARNWRAKADEAVAKLKTVRPQVRYPLYGLDEGLRTLS